MDIREILLHIRAGSSARQIERDTKIDRRTIKRYKDWAQAQGLLEGALPSLEELQGLADQTLPKQTPPQNVSSVEPYRGLVEQLVKENVEIAAIKCRLEDRGYSGSYQAVYRFAYRRATHAEPLHQLCLSRKGRAERQVLGGDLLPEGFADLVIEGKGAVPMNTHLHTSLVAAKRHSETP